MAIKAAVREDGSVLSRLDRMLYRVEGWFALVSGMAVFGLMLLAVYSVGGRNMMNRPVSGYVDWIEIIMPLIAFMGISYAQRDGGHIRMDILIGRLKGRMLWLAEFVSTLAILLVIVLLIWGSWSHFGRSFDWAAPNFSRDSTIDIGLPIWPAKLLAPVAFSVMALRLCLQLWGYGRAIVTNDAIAVPMIEDIATIAAREAQAVSGARDAQ